MNEMQAAVAAEGRRMARFAEGARPEGPSATIAHMRIRVFDSLADAEPTWRSLEAESDGTVFQTFDLAAAWQKTLGARLCHVPAVVMISDAARPVALIPLAVSAGPIRRLIWLGQPLFDYLGPLVARDCQQLVRGDYFGELWQQVRMQLQQDARFRHDLIELRKMPRRLGANENPFLSLPVIPHPSNGYVAALNGTWDAFYRQRRSAKARKQDRSKRRRLQELGTIEIFTAHSRRDTKDLLGVLFDQKARTFNRKGIDGFFRKPECRAFFVELANELRRTDAVHVSALRVGGEFAAVNFGLEYRGRYSLLQVSYDERFARFSPGALHLNELIRRALGRGLTEFDFLAGYQRLKAEWSDQKTALFDHIQAATPRGWAFAMLARAHTHVKGLIKRTPALWATFARLRTALGTLRKGGSRTGC